MRWQQMRVQLLPLFVCGGAAAAVVFLWSDVSGPVGIPGEVEIVASQVAAADAGMLAEIRVQRFDRLEAGETVGWLITNPPELTRSSLAVLQAEIELTRLGWIDPVLDQQRNLLQVETLKLDLLAAQTELAINKIQLMQAERDLVRKDQLFQSNMIAEETLEAARLMAEVLAAEVTGNEELAAQIGRSVTNLGGLEGEGPDFSTALRASLALQTERLRQLEAELSPVPLRAPIGGIVSDLFRGNGEYVAAGEPILSISAPESEAIVAFLRQPLAVPSVGTPVEIHSRRSDRLHGTGQVIAVGPHVQEMTPGLQRPVPFRYESGLPVKVSLPPELKLLPGEIVDLIFQ